MTTVEITQKTFLSSTDIIIYRGMARSRHFRISSVNTLCLLLIRAPRRHDRETAWCMHVVPADNEKLPSFYWLPKLHKNPYSYRFIAASSACTTKPLSKLLTQCLKLVLKHYSQYCAGIERKTGINWSTDILNSLTKMRRASHLDSFDFSTLYTKIPHNHTVR